ncbi:Bifunctional transcriptional activator/DNA repair enzyme AdaA [Pontiella desulfatans]|uniref:Bifunctional transcriptional activator/DNA repair enzyme AdaA n=1 Tax=Pontiella desulfatans TaxID=2750659 RepID=A0A6C2U7P7_PONDE|nr:AraC family transcriptional regulator [Pontiella desulfatans]VGO15899.1 Bifunctional transcriptional activator/DNA repair enzyme AdaA [Pontiella desulfatans]
MGWNRNLKIDTLRLGLYEAGHCRLSREWNYPRLASPFSRIYLIEEGEAVIRHSGLTHHLKKGDLHLVPCHVTADYQCPDFQTQYFVGFTTKLEIGADLFALRRCDPTLKADGTHWEIFKRLVGLLEPLAGGYGRLAHVEIPLAVSVEVRGLVLQLAAAFLRTAHEPTDVELEREGRFAPILQFVDENLQRDIALETLAELAGLTPTYFSDLFVKTIGVRPVEFINRRRIERAQLLLGSTRMTVQEVADAVGINSSAYFSRLFHRVAGIPPRRYRQLLLGEESP